MIFARPLAWVAVAVAFVGCAPPGAEPDGEAEHGSAPAAGASCAGCRASEADPPQCSAASTELGSIHAVLVHGGAFASGYDTYFAAPLTDLFVASTGKVYFAARRGDHDAQAYVLDVAAGTLTRLTSFAADTVQGISWWNVGEAAGLVYFRPTLFVGSAEDRSLADPSDWQTRTFVTDGTVSGTREWTRELPPFEMSPAARAAGNFYNAPSTVYEHVLVNGAWLGRGADALYRATRAVDPTLELASKIPSEYYASEHSWWPADRSIAAVGRRAFFVVSDTNGARLGELWWSDGTVAGTSRVPRPWANKVRARGVVSYRNRVYFSGDYKLHGRELMSTDGCDLAIHEAYEGEAGTGAELLTATPHGLVFVERSAGPQRRRLWIVR